MELSRLLRILWKYRYFWGQILIYTKNWSKFAWKPEHLAQISHACKNCGHWRSRNSMSVVVSSSFLKVTLLHNLQKLLVDRLFWNGQINISSDLCSRNIMMIKFLLCLGTFDELSTSFTRYNIWCLGTFDELSTSFTRCKETATCSTKGESLHNYFISKSFPYSFFYSVI